MSSNLGGKALPAPETQDSELQVLPNHVLERQRTRADLRLRVAELYGRGFKRRQVAKALAKRLVPGNGPVSESERVSKAVRVLLHWERTEEFRDLVWQASVEQLDRESPAILRGVTRAAKRGRVDAARLSLEVTGRHNPKADQTVTNVTVQIANIPRPEGEAIRPVGEIEE